MKILVLAESLNPSSGWGAYARALVAELRARGSDLIVLTADSSSESLPRPACRQAGRSRGGPRLPSVNGSRFSWFRRRLELRSWMANQSFDLVHVMAEPYARLWRAFGRVPFIMTAHGTFADPAAHGVAAAAFRAAIARANRIVAVSDYTRERIATDLRSKTVVIPNGVDPEIVREPFDEVPSHGSPLILSVGAMKARKGFDRLISGFAEFARTQPNAELVIIGRDDDPKLRQRLVAQAESLGMAGRVRLFGEVSRAALLGWYRACDAFALTSVEDGGFEGFGLVYLEANAFGKPCVGSRDSGARDVIHEGRNGYLANADDQLDIARSLSGIVAFLGRYSRVCNGCRLSLRAESYQALYAEVADSLR